MIVMKFGGTSVASPENIKRVLEIIKKKTESVVVVFSAFSGCTNDLDKLASESLKGSHHQILNNISERHIGITKELIAIEQQPKSLLGVKEILNELEDFCGGISLIKELSDRSKAKILSFGELLSTFIISEALPEAEFIDSRSIIKTNNDYLLAKVDFNKSYKKIQDRIKNNGQSYILPGFIATSTDGHLTTLGRGGSDYTAAILAGALNASSLEIWSDVDGMLEANPKNVKQAKVINQLSYHEAFELSHFGAKVIYPPAIRPVFEKKIPVLLKNTFNPESSGSLINDKSENLIQNGNAVIGISNLNEIALLTVSGIGMIGISGYSKRVFSALEKNKINVILISQSCSEHSICIAVENSNKTIAKTALDTVFENERNQGSMNPVFIEDNLSILALVGNRMKQEHGISGKAFSALGENGINVKAIAQGSSERNISIVIDTVNEKKASNVLFEKFFGNAYKTVHLFVFGIGNVGGELMQIIKEQQQFLKEHYHIDLRVVGLSNSRHMLFDLHGINLSDYKNQLIKSGLKADSKEFVKNIEKLNKRNSIVIDNTASKHISDLYKYILDASISVVACNKIAPSNSFKDYKHLKKIAKRRNVQFRFETCVGAALPVLNTINDLILSGDEVFKIEAVLSGSLNFIFNNYDGKESFSSIVRIAQEEGYTEPDPLIDLGGTDVMRKILILVREAGYELEMENIINEKILPDECLMSNNTFDLFKNLEKHEDYFASIYQKANKKDCKLKFVATYKNGKASVGLKEITSDHPFYNVAGKDNIVAFTTNRYGDQPLVIKGAGAGAEITASGVYSDIMRIINN